MANAAYTSFKRKIMDGSIDLDTDTIHVAMLTTAYSFDATAHSAWSDVSADEITATGYTSGGSAVGTTCYTDTASDRGVFDADDAAWTGIDADEAGYIIVYKNSGAATTSWLIAQIDTTTGATLPVTFNGGDFTVQWAASGSGGVLYLS
jgi:hypothetical protein